MPIAQVRNASLQELGSTDHLDVEDRNFAAEWYDGTGGASYIAAITIPLSVTRHNAAPTIYSVSSNILTITEAGGYLFHYLVHADKAGSNEGAFYAYLEEDPATGTFAQIPATWVTATVFGAPGTVGGTTLVRAGINYRYRLVTGTYGVQFTTVADGSKLTVMRCWKNG